MGTYDVEAARKSGLTDADIAPALASRTNYDLEGARKAGVPDAEIVNTLVGKYNQSFPLSGENQGNQPAQFRPSQTMLDRANKVRQEATNTIMMRDPGVDYETGVKDFGLRTGFGRMSNDAERENYLSKNVGEGNFGKDKYGRYYIHPEGLAKIGIQSTKPVALDESGTSRYDVADVLGDAPAMLGATGGAMAASGAGLFPGMVAAAGGAMLGKGLDEAIKAGQGYNLKSAGENVTNVLGEGAAAAAGEGIGRAVIGVGRFAMNPYGRLAEAERQGLTKEAMDAGFAPKVFQFQPGGKLLARFQSMGENVLGDKAAAQNAKAMESGMASLEGKTGTPTPDLGDRLIAGVKNNIADLQQFTTRAKDTANRLLDDSLSTIRRTLGSTDPNAGAVVQDQIKSARKQFGAQASELYAKVDAIAGGKPIVPTSQIKQELSDLAANLPTDQAGKKIFPTPELQQFMSKYGNIGDYQTTQQMQQLRTDFREAAESFNLVPGVDKRRASMLKNSVDRAFDDAMESAVLHLKVTSPIVDAEGKNITSTVVVNKPGQEAAIMALREADAFYKQGIKKFDAPSIAALTRDASQTGAVEPMRVVDTIIKPGYSAAAMRVKGLVTPETWEKVQRTHFESLTQDATRLIDGLEQISGATLFNKIRDMGSTFNVVYGDKAAPIRKYAAELAARDGKLDPSLLKGNIADNLRIAVAKQRDLDSFLKDNYLSSLAKPGQEAVQASDFIFKPNSPMRIAQAKKFYGETSPEFQGLQNSAMQKLLADVVKPGADPLKTLFDGKSLNATLKTYGRSTLEETFGKQTTDDLFQFAKVAQFVTQTNPNSGGIVAAAVALRPLNNIWKIVDLAGTSYLLRQPGAIKWLSEGIQPGNKAAAAGAITRLGALATALVKDKTSSGSMDLTRPEYKQ